MTRYYVSTKGNANGYHEVHKSNCTHLPDLKNRLYLGDFLDCKNALKKVRLMSDQVNGCPSCLPCCYINKSESDVTLGVHELT